MFWISNEDYLGFVRKIKYEIIKLLISLKMIRFFFFDLSLAGSIQLRLDTPNHCYRCDFKGGKKVKKCPVNGFDTSNIEVIECGYQKPICGITVNVTGNFSKTN